MASNYCDDLNDFFKKGELLKNRFEIIERIGEGSFGFVYKVFDNENEKEKYVLVFKSSQNLFINKIKIKIDVLLKS